jgi:Zn-finger nucleic acid-binding protein
VGTEVDACPECGGMFLDRGELNRVAAPTVGDLEYSTVHSESFRHDDRFAPTSCPRCDGVEMKKVEFNIYTGIILDYCASCEGFWLDGEELTRINEEVRKLDEEAGDDPAPSMRWFANFIWSLPR